MVEEGELRTFDEDSLFSTINRGEKSIYDVDWVTFLRNILWMSQNKANERHITWVSIVWGFTNELVDYNKRIDLLGLWQTKAQLCFENEDECKRFVENCDAVIRYNLQLRGLILHHGAKVPHLYDHVELGGRGLNELALVWERKNISGVDLVMLAEEIYQAHQRGEKEPMIEEFLQSYRYFNHISFNDVLTFSRFLFLAESFRQYLVDGKMQTSAPLTFGDFNRKLRNESFEEYIRLRIEQIREEQENNNWLLLDPTDEDCYQQLYKEEESVANREFGFEQFRGSIAYSQQWYDGRPDVLNMIKYFMDYLSWKMEHLDKGDMSKNHPTQVINGDYIAGNKYTGTIIEKVEPGGIGVQNVYTTQRPQRPAAAPTNTEKRESAPFEPDFMTFTKERTSDYNIIALYQELLKVKWIEDGNPDDFAALFEGKNTECRIVWSGKVGKDNLYALFKMMVDNHFIRLPEGHSLQRIVESHFVDAEGNYITGIDSGKPSKSALSTIEQMRKILAARQTFDN